MSLPAAGYLENAARTEGELKTALEDLLKAIKQIPGAGVAEQALTIATGTITPAAGASGIIVVDTEGAAASDTLSNIAVTNVDDNSLVILRNANASRLVIVDNNAGGSGQISLKSAGDFVLADPDRHWLLVKRSGTTFKEVARFPSADLAPILSKSSAYTTTAADRGQFIDCTATLTLTLLAAATAGVGFEQCVQCSAGVTTIDPNAAETIGGLSSLVLQRGDKVWFVSNGTNWDIVMRHSAQGGPPVHGHLWGLTLANGTDATNDIDVAVGEAMSDDTDSNDAVLIRLTTAITKQLDAVWAVGTAAGGRASGGAITDTTYHVFLIMRPDTGVVDVAFDTSETGANLAANTNAAYTKKRCIGSILRESASIVAFTQNRDEFLRTTPVQNVAATNPGTSAVTRTLGIPVGRVLDALINSSVTQVGTNAYVYLSPLTATDQAPSASAAPGFTYFASNVGLATWGIGGMRIKTNASAQIRSRLSASDANTVLYINTLGWIDRRGRLN